MVQLIIIQPSKPLTLKILPSVHTTNTAPKKRINKYTLSVFLERAKEVHGDKYDYSLVREEHIKISRSKVPVICKLCNHTWSPVIKEDEMSFMCWKSSLDIRKIHH